MKANYDLRADEQRVYDDQSDGIVEIVLHDVTIEALGNTAFNPLVGDPMKNFEKRPLIRGNDAELMSDNQILGVIGDIDSQIKALESATTETKTANKMIKDLKAENVRIVKYLDGRNGDDD